MYHEVYEVTFKHYYNKDKYRIISYKVFLESAVDFEDGDGGQMDPAVKAVEYAMPKFFTDYILIEGSRLEVVSVEPIEI